MFDSLKKRLDKLGLYDEKTRLNLIVTFFYLTGLFSLFIFFVRGLFFEDIHYVKVLTFFMTLSVVCFAIFRYTKNEKFGAWSATIIMFALELVFLFDLTENSIGYLWFFLFPFLTIFMLGKYWGSMVSLILFITAIVLAKITDWNNIDFSSYFLLRFASAYFSVWALSLIYEIISERVIKDYNKIYQKSQDYLYEIREINDELRTTNKDLLTKTQELEIARQNINESISYAQYIQSKLLPSKELMQEKLQDYFLIFMPVDRISGDFYYVNKVNDYVIFAIGDCTGHGIAGGLLSVLSISLLHEIVRRKEADTAGKVLDLLRDRLKSMLAYFSDKDFHGLDLALVAINEKTDILYYSGANLPMFLLHNNEIHHIKCTKNPIGYYFEESRFYNFEMKISPGDIVYLTSDGIFSQIGGNRNKKVKKSGFINMIEKIALLPIEQQKNSLLKDLYEWQGENNQIDDITVLAVKWKGK